MNPNPKIPGLKEGHMVRVIIDGKLEEVEIVDVRTQISSSFLPNNALCRLWFYKAKTVDGLVIEIGKSDLEGAQQTSEEKTEKELWLRDCLQKMEKSRDEIYEKLQKEQSYTKQLAHKIVTDKSIVFEMRETMKKLLVLADRLLEKGGDDE